MNVQLESYREKPRLWIRGLMEEMIKSHRASKEFNKELKILSHSMPEVSAVMEKQQDSAGIRPAEVSPLPPVLQYQFREGH